MAVRKRAAVKPTKERALTEQATARNKSGKKFSLTTLTSYRPTAKGWIIIAVVLALILFAVRKDLLLAATVNGAPIANLELLSRLNQQYRTQELNQLINEKLIAAEAQKNGVTISPQEINERISQLEGNVGGAQALDNLLAQQGQSRSTLKDQLKIQLTIEKLYAKDATVSAEEVEKFIADNKSSLQATTSAEQTKEATNILKQQKLGKAFNEKFQELKQNAKIQIF